MKLHLIFSTLALTACVGIDHTNKTNRIGLTAMPAAGKTLCNEHFCYGYDKTRKSVVWTGYQLMAQSTPRGSIPPVLYQDEPKLGLQTEDTIKHFYRAGYDVGSLVNMEALTTSTDSAKNVQLVSVKFPIDKSINRGSYDKVQGPWYRLQDFERRHANLRGKLSVINGLIFSKGSSQLDSGQKVPDFAYKVLLDAQREAVKSFLVPLHPHAYRDLSSYEVTIDEIEKLAKMNIPSFDRRYEKDLDNAVAPTPGAFAMRDGK